MIAARITIETFDESGYHDSTMRECTSDDDAAQCLAHAIRGHDAMLAGGDIRFLVEALKRLLEDTNAPRNEVASYEKLYEAAKAFLEPAAGGETP